MINKLLTLALLGTLLTTTAAFADDVYVTANGKKYHKEDCRLIKTKHPVKIEKSEAVKKGLEPCKSCFREPKQDAKK